MISLDNITVAYGGYVLLDKIGFHISGNDRIGLVGKNGAGKSTILKLIAGLQSPTSGHIDRPSDVRIGYLPQIMEHHKGLSVIDEAMTAFAADNRTEREIDLITRELSERTDYESKEYTQLIERLSQLNDILVSSHSEPPRVQAEKTLMGLGFKSDELDRATETFSQGWNMRIELAKILLQRPDVLLLDEPTNHLDIESIDWLENYLAGHKASLVLVSHDRRFLDNVTNRTVEIMLGHITDYKVPYSKYLELRAERMQQQIAAFQNQQRMIEKTEEFIRTFRYKPTKSNQVQSRIKALEKLDRLEIEEDDSSVALSVKFPPSQRAGDVVYRTAGLKAGYPDKTVFDKVDIEIKRGEKVALVGRNGEGKTTLMRVLTGELKPLGGESVVGYNVNVGYFAQNQEDILDPGLTVFETLDRIAVGDIRTRLRDILAAFLFRGDDIDKKVSVLSGGERARLGMAKLMLQSHNLLALDEPTNHMDIRSKEVLKKALESYDGTLVVVSHDRDFLDGLVDKMYEFRDGRVYEHLGSVGEFLQRRRIENLSELERRFDGGNSPEKKMRSAPAHDKRKDYEEGRMGQKEERRRRKRVEELEDRIAHLEQRMKNIETILSSPGENDDIMELTREYLEKKRELDEKTEEWAKIAL